jgi:hypothetical protein
VNGNGFDGSEFESRQVLETLCPPEPLRLALGPIGARIQQVLGDLSLLRRTGREDVHSHPSSDSVKKNAGLNRFSLWGFMFCAGKTPNHCAFLPNSFPLFCIVRRLHMLHHSTHMK